MYLCTFESPLRCILPVEIYVPKPRSQERLQSLKELFGKQGSSLLGVNRILTGATPL